MFVRLFLCCIVLSVGRGFALVQSIVDVLYDCHLFMPQKEIHIQVELQREYFRCSLVILRRSVKTDLIYLLAVVLPACRL
jgi:hypothetical protein